MNPLTEEIEVPDPAQLDLFKTTGDKGLALIHNNASPDPLNVDIHNRSPTVTKLYDSDKLKERQRALTEMSRALVKKRFMPPPAQNQTHE